MASRTTVTLVDDLDGDTADETVPFGLDGATYEIDLSSAHAEELRAALEQYVAAGRRNGGQRTGGRRSSPASAPSRSSTPATGSSRARNQEIRAWANSHGVALGDRGRIPNHVVAAFEAGDPSRLRERELTDTATSSNGVDNQPAPASSSPAVVEEPVGGEEPRGRDGLTAAERETIRAWAVNEGIEVKTRGQLKKDLIANYEAWSARQG